MNEPDATKLQNPTQRRAFVVVQRGDARMEVVELPATGMVTIGRAPGNHIVVADPKCSRHHCELFYRAGQWHVRDLESRNGIALDGERVVGEQPLDYGQTMKIGAYSLLFTDSHPDDRDDGQLTKTVFGATSSSFEIIERKSGTLYDDPSGMHRIHGGNEGATELFRLARAMAATTDESRLAAIVMDGLIGFTQASMGGVLISPPGDDEVRIDSLQPGAVYGSRKASDFSTYLTNIALRDRDAILAHDISKHSSLSKQESLNELEAESAICAPVRHGEEILGVIHLYSVDSDSPLSQPHLEFVLAVADQMGDQLHALREKMELAEGLDRVRRHVSDLQDQLQAETELVGHSKSLEDVRRSIARVSPTDALVLIRGESGVGKELVARALHFNSLRKDGPFVCVNCAALTESLLESELFGHEKGAFTGAAGKRAGKFEQAHGGTLFLDEIGEMSPEIQAKFLRVLEGQPFERVGGGEPITVDVRVVTATNRNLEEAVREKQFRRDLFFRLQVIEISVPPLREHPEDIAAIAQHFVQRFATQSHRRCRGFTSAAIKKLTSHSWPGNVRELRNVVERAVILANSEVLEPADVVLTNLALEETDDPRPDSMKGTEPEIPVDTAVDPELDLWGSFIQQNMSLDDIDRLYIEAVLQSTDWNKSAAARILQIERTTLDRRLKKYGTSRPGDENDEDDL
ncbi:MAG: sigma 54-interacting transcriptional regulator [Planctomycetaceae bacterium]|nr:sigma 54-interacting transcriptional regulator [Planctomycetaceae bacterium]